MEVCTDGAHVGEKAAKVGFDSQRKQKKKEKDRKRKKTVKHNKI